MDCVKSITAQSNRQHLYATIQPLLDVFFQKLIKNLEYRNSGVESTPVLICDGEACLGGSNLSNRARSIQLTDQEWSK